MLRGSWGSPAAKVRETIAVGEIGQSDPDQSQFMY